MANYPINHHILAEDFREQQAGNKEYNQGDGEWLHVNLLKMCEAYDELVEERDRLRKDIELSVCYSPGAIRDSFDGYDEDDENAQWAYEATDEQLEAVSYMIVGSDPTWKDFHENIEMCVEEMRTRKE